MVWGSGPAVIASMVTALVGTAAGRPVSAVLATAPLLISVWRYCARVPLPAKQSLVAVGTMIAGIAADAGWYNAMYVFLMITAGACLAIE